MDKQTKNSGLKQNNKLKAKTTRTDSKYVNFKKETAHTRCECNDILKKKFIDYLPLIGSIIITIFTSLLILFLMRS